MKKIYNLFLGIILTGTIANAQVVFQSNLSSWSGGLPVGWMGSTTTLLAANIAEVTSGATYGTSMAALKNTTTTHKRFSTKTVAVTAGGTYEIKFWVSGVLGNIRSNYYNVTGATYGTYNAYVAVTPTQTMVTQTVTLPSPCDSAQFILSIQSTDAAGILLDSFVVSNAAAPVATPATIYQIQHTTTPPYDSPFNTQLISTSGVVTAIQSNGYYLQDGNGPWNGVFVLDYTYHPTKGDVVSVTGTVEEYFNLTEIKGVIVYNAVAGGVLPTPTALTTLAANDEQYEGTLVKVTNAACTADTTSNTTREWTINDGSGALIADDKMFIYAPTLTTAYNVTGIVDYSFSFFKLLPRDVNDIQLYTSIEEINNYKVSVYPNPVQNQINFELNASNFSVKIIDVTGKTISNNSTLSNKLKVNTSSLNNGLYFYSVINNNGEVITSSKFIVAK